MTEWRRVLLGEVATLNRKALGKSWPFSHLRYIDISSVGEGFLEESPTYFELAGAPSRAKRLLSSGDTVLSTVRPDRRSMFYAKDPGADWVVSTGFCTVTANSDVVDPKFLYYCLFTRKFTDYLVAHEKGAAYPAVTADDIANAPILLPPLEQQRAIAATLGALDDKIESNRRTIALIPQLVRARVDASLSQASDRIAVAELARFVNGGAYTKGATGTGRMVIRIAELNSGPGGSTVYNDMDVPDEKTARAGDILMSWSGSLGVYRWFRDEAIVNQHIFKVIPTGYPAWLVFDRLDAVMPIFRGVAADKATTMGHIQRGHLESTNVEIPVVPEIEQLNEILSPLWERLLSAEREVVRLTKLRDALLPELLSGRMRVPAEGVAA